MQRIRIIAFSSNVSFLTYLKFVETQKPSLNLDLYKAFNIVRYYNNDVIPNVLIHTIK